MFRDHASTSSGRCFWSDKYYQGNCSFVLFSRCSLHQARSLRAYRSPPAYPPSYDLVNPNKEVRFPIFGDTAPCPKSSLPPLYAPAVYELTLISLKLERLSPYEISSNRSWRNFIIEINSTQLNFYHIDESLTKHIRNYSSGETKSEKEDRIHSDLVHRSDQSQHLHHRLFTLPTRSASEFKKADQERVSYRVKRDRSRYLTDEALYKSFTLQNARFGIPTDYTKKSFVLRMSCESEQFYYGSLI